MGNYCLAITHTYVGANFEEKFLKFFPSGNEIIQNRISRVFWGMEGYYESVSNFNHFLLKSPQKHPYRTQHMHDQSLATDLLFEHFISLLPINNLTLVKTYVPLEPTKDLRVHMMDYSGNIESVLEEHSLLEERRKNSGWLDDLAQEIISSRELLRKLTVKPRFRRERLSCFRFSYALKINHNKKDATYLGGMNIEFFLEDKIYQKLNAKLFP